MRIHTGLNLSCVKTRETISYTQTTCSARENPHNVLVELYRTQEKSHTPPNCVLVIISLTGEKPYSHKLCTTYISREKFPNHANGVLFISHTGKKSYTYKLRTKSFTSNSVLYLHRKQCYSQPYSQIKVSFRIVTLYDPTRLY